MADDLPDLLLPDPAAWRAWLHEHHATSPGVWLVLGKGKAVVPTSVRWESAVTEALCYGWIDGQSRKGDETVWYQRFTPRRPRSIWSQKNVATVGRLTEAGLMQPAGLAAVDAAKADGRWDAAYVGPATAEVPDDLAAAVAASPVATEVFGLLNRTNRFAVLHRVGQAKKPETRARRIAQFVEMLERRETVYPQKGLTPDA
ncbi:YdeI/OmpD-associated family protein [Angustibacter peucedani]